MTYHLTLAEQETTINWDNELNTASIYTHDARLIRRLRELAEKYPSVFLLERSSPDRSVTYRVPKQLITVRAPYDEERRQKQRERALNENYIKRFGEIKNPDCIE